MDKRSFLFVSLLTLSFFAINHFFTPAHKAAVTITTVPVEKIAPPQPQIRESQKTQGEEFYILENEYQQIVFSNIGGAISEINLPFKARSAKSTISPIEFDRHLEENAPRNELFPLFAAYKWENGQKTKVLPGSSMGYYPMLRRTLLNKNGAIASLIDPKYYALTVKGADLDETVSTYKVSKFSENEIQFTGTANGHHIVKTYNLGQSEAPYSLQLSIKIDGAVAPLHLYSGALEAEIVSNNYSPELKYGLAKNSKIKLESIKLPKTFSVNSSTEPEWLCGSNGFFGMITDSKTPMPSGFSAYHLDGSLAKTRLCLIDAQYDVYPANKYPAYLYSIPLSGSGDMVFRFYAGPMQKTVLKQVDAAYTREDGKDPQYIQALSVQGFFAFVSEPFAKLLLVLMQFFFTFTRSWGLSIILLTVALRLMLYPLNAWSIRSNLKMQKMSPKVKALQLKFKDDKRRAQVETMNLYRENGVNPLTGGCFPLLIQMPFLIGMYELLRSTFELRGASFIPGWITNLTMPDVLFTWDYPIPMIGNAFHLLPFLVGAVMFFQSRMAITRSRNKSEMTDEERKQIASSNITTVFITVLFYRYPSGLNLYFLSSSLLAILQQYWTTKKGKDARLG